MKTARYQRFFVMVLCAVLLTMLLPVTANADIGAEPSVYITFENLGDTPCYGTLLSPFEFSPYNEWDGTEEDANYEGSSYTGNALPYEVWKTFVEYEDTDGYCFLQEGWIVSETKEIDWSYFGPRKFKILLYYPEMDRFTISDIYDCYAFETYYTVDMTGIDPASLEYGEAALSARRSYDYSFEIVALFVRILLTIGIKMAIALLYGFREKKQLQVLVVVNGATQILLNVLLAVFSYKSGPWAFIVGYIYFEMAVFLIEAVAYCIWMRKVSEVPRKRRVYVVYAMVANAVSFFAGLIIPF